MAPRVPAHATLSSPPLTPPPHPRRVVSACHAALAFGQGVYWFAASPESRVAFSRPFAFLPANALIEAVGVAYFLYDVLAMLAFARHVSRAFFRGIMVHHAIFIVAYASTLVRHSHDANVTPQHDHPQCARPHYSRPTATPLHLPCCHRQCAVRGTGSLACHQS
jgi:TLC domain